MKGAKLSTRILSRSLPRCLLGSFINHAQSGFVTSKRCLPSRLTLRCRWPPVIGALTCSNRHPGRLGAAARQ